MRISIFPFENMYVLFFTFCNMLYHFYVTDCTTLLQVATIAYVTVYTYVVRIYYLLAEFFDGRHAIFPNSGIEFIWTSAIFSDNVRTKDVVNI